MKQRMCKPLTTFEAVAMQQIPQLAALAREIWTEYYSALLGADQIEYMLAHFQSEAPMRRQLEAEQYRYFFLRQKGELAGYLGVQIQENALFLSKLYIRAAQRGQGTARDVFAFLEGWARGAGLSRIWLTVNRGNKGSIAAYERLGYHNAGTLDADIGGGYVMDDFIFEKNIV